MWIYLKNNWVLFILKLSGSRGSPCRWLSFKNDTGKMPTVFLDEVSKPLFKIVHDTGQQLTIDRTNFLTDGFLQIIQRTGFVSVNTRFQIPPEEKITRWKAGRARGPWHVSETGNEVPGKCFEQWSLTRCSTGQVSIATEVANPEEKNANHIAPPPLGLPTEYYPFKRCQVPVGHPVR